MKLKVHISFQDDKPVFLKYHQIRDSLTAIIYSAINNTDPELANKIHQNKQWITLGDNIAVKLYTFSYLFSNGATATPEGVFFPSPHMHFFISSPDTAFMSALSGGFVTGSFTLAGREIVITPEKKKMPKLGSKVEAETLSPVIPLGNKEGLNHYLLRGRDPVRDSDEAIKESLRETMRLKYSAYIKEEIEDKNFDFYVPEILHTWPSRVDYSGRINYSFYANSGTFILKGSPEIIEFASDAGLGIKTGMGCGYIKCFSVPKKKGAA